MQKKEDKIFTFFVLSDHDLIKDHIFPSDRDLIKDYEKK